MKHWHWIPLVFLAVALAAVVIAVPRLGGAPASAAPPDLTVSLDMDTTDGGPCADIDASTSHTEADPVTGPVYDVAICVTGLYNDLPYAIGRFGFDVLYNDQWNKATEVTDTDTGLDDNPDANTGATTFGSSNLGSGSGWDCSGGGKAYPMGDKNVATGPGNGDAFIDCQSLAGPWTMGDDETDGVIAVIEFKAIAEGNDTLTIALGGNLVYANSAVVMGQCNPSQALPIDCFGGEDNKTGATAVPTNTPTDTPTATATPNCGGEGQPACTPTRRPWTLTPTPTVTATPKPEEPSGPSEPQQPPPPPPPTGGQLPQVVPPGTGSGPDGIAWASTAVWLLVAAGAVSVSLGGLYLRRARRR